MNLKQLLAIAKPKELMVCETDGFSLRAVVVTRTGKSISILHEAETENADMAEALATIIEQLKVSGWHGGKAILLSPAVFSTLVELPVNPKKPRPLAQMTELIRWEVEPLLMQHTTRWSLANLLVAQGYMTEEQATAVLDLQQGKANAAGGLELSEKFSFRKFGELAEELGYIRRSQLNACLSGQEWLKTDDEGMECGWLPQAAVPDVPGMFNWLVSCVSQSLMQRWIDLFAKHKVSLLGMYPLTGCSLALLSQQQTETAVILESNQNLSSVIQLQAGKVIALSQHLAGSQSPLEACLESFHSLNTNNVEHVFLSSASSQVDLLKQDLEASLNVEVKLTANNGNDGVMSLAMQGAALRAFELNAERLYIGVRPGGPLPPVKERPEFRLAGLGAVLMLCVIAAEVQLLWQKNGALSIKNNVDEQWKTIDQATKRITKQIDAIEVRKTQLKQQQQQQLKMTTLVDFYNRDIPERVALVKAVLGILQQVVDENVIIQSIDELGKRVPMYPAGTLNQTTLAQESEVENFNIEAWALTEASAQGFIQNIKRAVSPLGLTVKDTLVRADTGPLGLDGFTVAMRIVKMIPNELLAKSEVVQ